MTAPRDDDARFAPADTISWNDAGETLVLFDSTQGGYFALNGAAVAIWRELARGSSVSEAAATLAARFDASCDAVAADIHAFVRDALDRQLLKPRA